jgi:hypothetical protein
MSSVGGGVVAHPATQPDTTTAAVVNAMRVDFMPRPAIEFPSHHRPSPARVRTIAPSRIRM